VIRNTTADMNNPDSGDRKALLAMGIVTGSPDAFIEAQERQGQAQLVNSDRLPTRTHDTDDLFLAAGFTFGDPDPGDDLFRPATLPAGWRRQASDHDMHSVIVDELGRTRVSIFYKAAHYDRRADMRLIGLAGYLADCIRHGTPVVPDDTWATPQAITVCARAAMAGTEKQIASWTGRGADRWAHYIEEYTAELGQYAAIAAHFDTPEGTR
jgi:hypothetical protein